MNTVLSRRLFLLPLLLLGIATPSTLGCAASDGAGEAEEEGVANEAIFGSDTRPWACSVDKHHAHFSVRFSAHPGVNQVYVDVHGKPGRNKSNVDFFIARPHMGWTENLYARSEDDVHVGRHKVDWDRVWGAPVLQKGDRVSLLIDFDDSGHDPACQTQFTTVR